MPNNPAKSRIWLISAGGGDDGGEGDGDSDGNGDIEEEDGAGDEDAAGAKPAAPKPKDKGLKGKKAKK